jgi:hypothetical protein
LLWRWKVKEYYERESDERDVILKKESENWGSLIVIKANKQTKSINIKADNRYIIKITLVSKKISLILKKDRCFCRQYQTASKIAGIGRIEA